MDESLDPRYAAWVLKQEAQEQLDQLNDFFAQRRAEGDPSSSWTPPAAEPPKPVRRAPEPPRRSPSPPRPDKIIRTVHDSAGRIIEAQTYEGQSASAARTWEDFTRSTARAEARRLEDQMAALAAEIGADIAKLERRIVDLEKLVEQLQGHEQPLAEAAD